MGDICFSSENFHLVFKELFERVDFEKQSADYLKARKITQQAKS